MGGILNLGKQKTFLVLVGILPTTRGFASLLVQVINGYFRTPKVHTFQKIILYFNKKYNTGLEVKPKDDSPLYSNALLGCLVLAQQMQILTLILQLENLENLVYNASALSIGRSVAAEYNRSAWRIYEIPL